LSWREGFFFLNSVGEAACNIKKTIKVMELQRQADSLDGTA